MEDLLGKHIFTIRERTKPGTGHFGQFSPTRQYEYAVVRCLVTSQNGDQVGLLADGNNNPELDNKTGWRLTSGLILMPGTNTIRVEEVHGSDGLGLIGIWKERGATD